VSEILLWVDVETSGVKPGSVLLEVAAQPTTFDAEFREIGKPFQAAIFYGDLRVAEVDPYVLAMHARNGLWEDARDPAKTMLSAADRFAGAVSTWQAHPDWYAGASVSLAGRSVHFDRDWLKRFALEETLEALNLSHRLFDLTPVKAFLTLSGVEFSVEETEEHRALGDVLADIKLARRLSELVANPLVAASFVNPDPV